MLLAIVPAKAQSVLTLEQCRQMALESNNDIKISEERKQEVEDLKKMALCNFFPTFSANGAYAWNQKNIRLLSDEQENRINNMGTTATNQLGTSAQNHYNSALQDAAARLAEINPELAQMLLDAGGSIDIGNFVTSQTTDLETNLNNTGHDITDAFNVNTHNIFAGSISINWPLFMGGRIREMYNIAKYTSEVAEIQNDKTQADLLLAVDEAYWRVASIQHKQELAEQYYNLLLKLTQDVEAMVAEGVATQSNVLQVKIKLNEARMSLTKANNGLTLSKMLLCQLCGMNLNSEFTVTDNRQLTDYANEENVSMDSVWNNRNEIRMLEYADKIAKSGVRLAAADLMPNLAVSGSYFISNPNLYNGFENKFGGSFMVGVVLNIPICHPADIYAVKAAKHQRNQIAYKMQDAKEKIQLQVNKTEFELEVAKEKLTQAQMNLENANENLRMANEAFAAGVMTANDVMTAQTAWLSANNDVIDAEIEVNMCELYYKQAIGIQ